MASLAKVLIIVENLPVPFDRRVWLEATTLQKAGYQVSVISPKSKVFNQEYEVIDEVHIYRYSLPPEESSVTGYFREYSWAIGSSFRLAQRVWQERGFDIIHICNPPDLLFLIAGWFKLRRGVKVIFDHHDLNPEMYEAKYNRHDIFYYGLYWAERLTFAIADFIIATNESHKGVALSRGKKREGKIYVVRSGPDLSRFRPISPNAIYRKGRSYLVGYVGVIGEPEGIDYLLRSVQYIVREKHRQDIHFMIIGDGPALEKMKNLTEKLQLTEFVEFTGFKMGEELLERLSSTDLCVEPSPRTRYNDCCTMNKILEYMAMGKPVVQFDLVEGRRSAAGASLYATPNDEVEFAEKIIQLLDNLEMREKMGLEGKRRMEELLEWRHQAPKLLDLYSRVLSKP
ncbi:MAG TPA: glycosyltransferase family 4 protein [Leptolyngbyaceae cyanobacterium]